MGTVLQRNQDTENYRINLTISKILTMLAAVLLSLVASAAAGGGYYPMAMARQVEAGNIVEELQRNGASTLVELAVKAGLADTLTGPGPFTIFAPTNAAFAALPADLVAAVTADTELLKSVLPPPTGWCTPSTPSSKLGTQSSGDIMYKFCQSLY